MDILKALDSQAVYSRSQLQLIIGAWVLSTLLERKKIALNDGDVAEDDYDKRSIYSLLYALYRAMGTVTSESGEPYEFTFNTWGYEWPSNWGKRPTRASDPQRYGKYAYAGLFHAAKAREYIDAHQGKVHIIEMGCGTGAGAHYICSNILTQCTYEAVDMQRAAIQTCEEKFVAELRGRLEATCADASRLARADASADFVAVNETHVTEMAGRITEEDERFFRTAHRVLKPGGFLVWGNAIPDNTWQPCFDFLASLGMTVLEARNVTPEAIRARDDDKARIDAYVDQCMRTFYGFRLPWLGSRRRVEAEVALKNFSRNPGTCLYEKMRDGTDSYRVVLVQKAH